MTEYRYKYAYVSDLLKWRKAHQPHIPDTKRHTRTANLAFVVGMLAQIVGLFVWADVDPASIFAAAYNIMITVTIILMAIALINYVRFRKITTEDERSAIEWFKSRYGTIIMYDTFDDIMKAYITDSGRILFAYDLIDTTKSNSHMVAIKIPIDAKTVSRISDPAYQDAIEQYIKTHQKSRLEVANLVHDLLEPVRHREEQRSVQFGKMLAERNPIGVTPTLESIERENQYISQELETIREMERANIKNAERIMADSIPK